MDEFKFITKEDLQNSVNLFYKVPMRSRNVIANKIHTRLKELDEYVNVYGENPILNYPSERFIVRDRKTNDNEYSIYKHYLDSNETNIFNYKVLEDMKSSLKTFTGVYDIVRFCKEQNNRADEIYYMKYPSHKDLIDVFKKAVASIELCFLYEISENRALQAMEDIEFVISTNILTGEHVKRLLLSVINLLNIPIFRARSTNIKSKIDRLYNLEIDMVKQKVDEFTLARPFNDSALRAYLKIQKIGHEESLVQSYYNGDYSITDKIFNVDTDLMQRIANIVRLKYPNIEPINMVDKFKLEQNGVTPIMNKMYRGNDYYVHMKKGLQYMVFKSKIHDDRYYLITELYDKNGMLKAYRITINEQNSFLDKLTSDTMLESTFVTDYRKMNRR